MSIDASTRARLVGLFVDEAHESVEALRRCAVSVQVGDTGEPLLEFGRVAHGLKGAAAALGYADLARALHQLESVALGVRRDADPAAAFARMARVREALETLSAGVARMAATSLDEYPADLLERLMAALAAAGPGVDPDGAEPRAAPPVVEPPRRADRGAEDPPARAGIEGIERLSVPAGDVDQALRLAASLARSAAQLNESLALSDGSVAASAQALAASAADLEAIIASLRLIPADVALAGIGGEVAELAARLGKEAALVVTGREVRADRRTLQTARGLIRHLVRNALDHGLESPAARVLAGKPRAGRVAIAVDAIESVLRVEVADDGAGFDVAAIRAELERRRKDSVRVQSLSDEQVLHHWAVEGGSTRASTTEVSGRGLGLSAVAQLARAAGGGVQVRSVRGLGSAVAFTLPLDVYAAEVVTLTVRGRTYGIPVSAVERTLFLPASGDAVHEGPAGRTLAVGEAILPLVPLVEALGQGRETGRERFAVVVQAEGLTAALSADEAGAVTSVVPAGVSGVAQPEALVSGLARLADGVPIALLNPRLLLNRARAVRAEARPTAATSKARRALDVVLAEDSLATREVLRVLLEEQGFRVRLAGDGEEAMQRVSESVPDVLVTDVNMPRRDGLWLTRSLRGQRSTERLPILLLTSRDDDAARAAGAAAGADAYLLKSQFNARVLAETLARLGVRGS